MLDKRSVPDLCLNFVPVYVPLASMFGAADHEFLGARCTTVARISQCGACISDAAMVLTASLCHGCSI